MARVHVRPLIICRHCHEEKKRYGRGLCNECYKDPEIRAKYARLKESANIDHEPTDEEVEAMIAERLPTMPGCSRKRRRPGIRIFHDPRLTAEIPSPDWEQYGRHIDHYGSY